MTECGKKYCLPRYATKYSVATLEDLIDVNGLSDDDECGGGKLIRNDSYYWLNTAVLMNDQRGLIYLDQTSEDVLSGATSGECGVRPIITLRNDLYAKKIKDSNGREVWDIK